MFGMNQGPMNSFQIMNILNNNPMMKYMTYILIQNPLMMKQMMNILNSLYYNQMLMIEIKNLINQEMNIMNIMDFQNKNMNQMMGNMGLNKEFNEFIPDNQINIIFRKKGTNFLINSSLDDKVSFAIQKYRDKFNDNDFEERFFFNSKILNTSLTLRESGISNGCIIQIITVKDTL